MTYAQDWLAQYPDTTRATYGQILGDFTDLLGVEPHKATQEDIIAYWKALSGQASATVAKKLAAMRSYFTYLNRRGVRADNPALIVKVPKVDRLRTINYLTGEQVDQMYQTFTYTPKDTRDRALISVLLHGLRMAEVVGLNAEDYKEGDLRVIGKGNKMRLVPLSPMAQTHLDTYLGNRKTGPMFLSIWARGDRIQRRAVRNIVYEVTERIGARTHPHALRHTAATIWMRTGGTLPEVQAALGHSDPKTTMIYSHLDTSDLRRMIEHANILGEQPKLRLLEGVA